MNATLVINPEEIALLVREAQAGDREAFEQILIAHQRLVLRVAYRMLGHMEDAQDAAQDVFLKLHKSLHQFQQGAQFTPWLYRMTVNTCLDIIRARRPQEPLKVERSMEASAESSLIAKERKQAVERALRELPEKERAAILLREVEGLSTREVADMLDSTEATVRSQIYQARVRLRMLTDKFLGRRS